MTAAASSCPDAGDRLEAYLRQMEDSRPETPREPTLQAKRSFHQRRDQQRFDEFGLPRGTTVTVQVLAVNAGVA